MKLSSRRFKIWPQNAKMTFETCQKRPPKPPLLHRRAKPSSYLGFGVVLVPKNMVRILKSNVQYHKVFSKIFLQFFLFPIRKNAWIKIFFTKFEGNIDNIRGEAENISILPENLVKKIEIQAFFLIGNKKKL